jgi:hypothetical protein
MALPLTVSRRSPEIARRTIDRQPAEFSSASSEWGLVQFVDGCRLAAGVSRPPMASVALGPGLFVCKVSEATHHLN